MKFLRNALASPQNLKTSFANRGHFGVRRLAAAFLFRPSQGTTLVAPNRCSPLATSSRCHPEPSRALPRGKRGVRVLANGGEGSAFLLRLSFRAKRGIC